MSRRTWLVVGVVLAAVVLGVVLVAVTSSPSPTSPGAAGSPAAGALPASASTTVPGGSQVVVAMGHLDEPSNTFYELFDRSTGDASWVLTTPPGVADNGGLVVGAAPTGALTAGFLPAADLTFSVLAQRPAGAASWTPASVPGTLAAEPDGLAAGPAGQVAAVLARPAPEVVTAAQGLTTWTRLTTVAALGGVSARCAVDRVTAVAIPPSGSPEVGTGCTGSSTVGIFASTPSGGWTLLGPVTAPGSPRATQVLRLQAGTTGPTALVEGTGGPTTTLAGVWGSAGAELATSAPLTVPTGWSVLGTSLGGGSGRAVTVLLGSASGSQRRVEVADPGADGGGAGVGAVPWTVLPGPPPGAAAVAVVGPETDAFVVSGNRLTVWATTPAAGAWSRVAAQTVPLQYGSSS